MSVPDADPPAGLSPRRPRSWLLPFGVACFAIGLTAIAVVLGLYLLGKGELPLWLNVAAVGCTSLGFALGLIALVREARSG